jgi:hypothetical protein
MRQQTSCTIPYFTCEFKKKCCEISRIKKTAKKMSPKFGDTLHSLLLNFKSWGREGGAGEEHVVSSTIELFCWVGGSSFALCLDVPFSEIFIWFDF